MTEPKFKPGMKCWHVTQGVVTLEENRCKGTAVFEHAEVVANDTYYYADGRFSKTDKFPTLLTLEEARARGFPVPKEPLRVELRVRWEEQDGWIVPCYEGDNPAFVDVFIPLLGKRGTLTFVESEDEQ